MILNTQSWHYKLVDEVSPVYADRIKRTGTASLCSYFWRVVFAALWAVIGTVAIAAAVSCITFILLVAPIMWFVAGIAGAPAFIGALVWLAVLAGTLEELIKRRKALEAPKEKKPNILFDYIAAKKSKVCPLMEVK